MCAKNAARDRNAMSGKRGFEILYERLRQVWGSCRAEAGTTTLACIGIEGKLRNDEGLPMDVEQGAVHFALVILKNTQVGNFIGQGFYPRSVVVASNTK